MRVADDGIRKALMAAANTKRDPAIIAVMFGSGMRLGELASLQADDVDIEASSVLVRRTKAGKPRTVPILPFALPPLRAWLIVRARRDVDTDALWLTPNDTPLGYEAIKSACGRLADRAGISFAPHDARRWFATEWIRRGGSEAGLQRACGWSSTRMVARYTRMQGEALAVDEAQRLWAS